MTAPITTRTARRRLAAFAGAVAFGVAAGACSEATTDPNSPVSIAFDSLPAPSIVLGDTLRDPETGEAVPLAAHAFNTDGQEIADPVFTYFVRDTGGALVVEQGNYLVAKKLRSAPVQVFASLNGLQLSQPITIVRRPDSLAAAADSITPISLNAPDNATNVSADSLRVKVLHVPTDADVAADSADASVSGVPFWVVRYTVEYAAPTVADSVRIVSTATGASNTADTTDASGVAGRLVRVFAKENAANGATDSVLVSASATYRGEPLRGAPIRLRLPVVVVR